MSPTAELPKTRTAVVADSNHGAVLTTLPVREPKAGELLVKVHYAALNPVDWKLLETTTAPGSVLLKDYGGVVAAVGSGVQGWAVGDRVAGIAMGGLGGQNDPDGGATDYATVDSELVWHVPDNISLAEATTYGIGGSTAALALYYHLHTPFPPATVTGAPWLIVSGGSTSVGLFLVQWGKLSGYRVVATASPRNFELVKSYGADKVVSYADHAAAVAEIRALQPPPNKAAELAGGPSWELSRAAVAGGEYVAVLPDPKDQAERVNFGAAFKPNSTYEPAVRKWAAEFYTRLPALVAAGAIRPGPVTVREGLELVPEGLKELKAGVSGTKLVFRVAPKS